MWTDNEKDLLIELYPKHSDKELCSILGKTAGQLRGMKERLGLNSKLSGFTEEEKIIIRNYYDGHPLEMDLSHLSSMIGRPKTSIARWAGKQGLTKNNRPQTQLAKMNSMASASRFRQTERYTNDILPKQAELLSYYAKHKHPRGMLGKHHTPEVKARMSKEHERIWREMDEESKRKIVSRIRSGCLASGAYKSTSSTYSRCHGGYREDLDMYLRSSWEANFARILNHLNLNWEYEPRRSHFPDIGDGVLSYCPDFYIPDANIWIEIKGWMDAKSLIRLNKFKDYFPCEYSGLILIDEKLYRNMIKRFRNKILNLENY